MERCRSLGQAIRQRIRENPQIVTLSEGVDALASFNVRCNGLMIRILWEAGFAGKEAILASQSLVSVAVKFAEIEAEASMPPPEAVRELAQAAAVGEEGDASKRLLDMASAYAELTVRDLFDYALERLIDGVETSRRAHHSPPS